MIEEVVRVFGIDEEFGQELCPGRGVARQARQLGRSFLGRTVLGVGTNTDSGLVAEGNEANNVASVPVVLQ